MEIKGLILLESGKKRGEEHHFPGLKRKARMFLVSMGRNGMVGTANRRSIRGKYREFSGHKMKPRRPAETSPWHSVFSQSISDGQSYREMDTNMCAVCMHT